MLNFPKEITKRKSLKYCNEKPSFDSKVLKSYPLPNQSKKMYCLFNDNVMSFYRRTNFTEKFWTAAVSVA